MSKWQIWAVFIFVLSFGEFILYGESQPYPQTPASALQSCLDIYRDDACYPDPHCNDYKTHTGWDWGIR